MREALPEIVDQGFFELLDEVYATARPYVGKNTPVMLRDAKGAERQNFIDFLYAPILAEDGTVAGVFVTGYDVTSHVLGERHLRLMNNELKHRVKNTLSMVSAIASQTLRGAESTAAATFQHRLEAFGRAHDALTAETWASASISDVVHTALRPHRTGAERFRIGGPPMVITAKHAISLTLALHELATNATKYGALSNETGKIDVAWDLVEGDAGQRQFHLVWRESGGPPVTQPLRRGFGSQIIERVLPAEFDGEVRVSFEPDGFHCHLVTAVGNLRQVAGESF